MKILKIFKKLETYLFATIIQFVISNIETLIILNHNSYLLWFDSIKISIEVLVCFCVIISISIPLMVNMFINLRLRDWLVSLLIMISIFTTVALSSIKVNGMGLPSGVNFQMFLLIFIMFCNFVLSIIAYGVSKLIKSCKKK